MNTHNIISTPEITGNIGTCETKKVEAMVKGGLIKNEYQVVMTNSCTGQVIKEYTYTDYSIMFLGLVIIGATLLWAIIAAIGGSSNQINPYPPYGGII